MIYKEEIQLSAQTAAFEWQEQSCANSLNPWKTKNETKKFEFSFFFIHFFLCCFHLPGTGAFN